MLFYCVIQNQPLALPSGIMPNGTDPFVCLSFEIVSACESKENNTSFPYLIGNFHKQTAGGMQQNCKY